MSRLPALLALLTGTVFAQTLPQDRQRTGMAEAGLRAWNVTLAGSGKPHEVGLVGASLSGFVTDNLSTGAMLAFLDEGTPADMFCLNGLARFYFFPMQRHTPWMELRVGGLIEPTGGTGASHLGASIGYRWRPLSWMALDLQLLGIERWGYDDPSEASNGNSDWSFQKSMFLMSFSGKDGIRLWPAPSLQFLF
ncbi:MAG: hypothetical protein RL173_3566 [Fibrobacterota bacterium]|jgi:hypothetical protein